MSTGGSAPLAAMLGLGYIYEAPVAAGREVAPVAVSVAASLSARAGVALFHAPDDALVAATLDVGAAGANFTRLYNRLGAGAAPLVAGQGAVFTTFLVPLNGTDWRPAFAVPSLLARRGRVRRTPADEPDVLQQIHAAALRVEGAAARAPAAVRAPRNFHGRGLQAPQRRGVVTTHGAAAARGAGRATNGLGRRAMAEARWALRRAGRCGCNLNCIFIAREDGKGLAPVTLSGRPGRHCVPAQAAPLGAPLRARVRRLGARVAARGQAVQPLLSNPSKVRSHRRHTLTPGASRARARPLHMAPSAMPATCLESPTKQARHRRLACIAAKPRSPRSRCRRRRDGVAIHCPVICPTSNSIY